MRIIQMLPTFAYGDAIGNDTIALYDTLKEIGYETYIYAEVIDARLPEKLAKQIGKYKCREDDVILYHLSTGSKLNYELAKFSCRKGIIYHNITPPEFFKHYSLEAEASCQAGLDSAKYLRDKVEFAFADSEFNKQDLINMGYTCPIFVLPILIKFDDYAKQPESKIIKRYKNVGYTNIIFTGRVAPNKKHENLIKSFYYYKNYWNPKARLFLVGGYSEKDRYYQQLKLYIQQLGIEDVYFTGHVKFNEILSYYNIADVYLCLSEHEGFCVPLVEAMYFKVPLIAYDKCAVGQTLGGAGLISTTNDPEIIAGLLDRLVKNKELRNQVIENEINRLKAFSHQIIKSKFLKDLKNIIEG